MTYHCDVLMTAVSRPDSGIIGITTASWWRHSVRHHVQNYRCGWSVNCHWSSQDGAGQSQNSLNTMFTNSYDVINDVDRCWCRWLYARTSIFRSLHPRLWFYSACRCCRFVVFRLCMYKIICKKSLLAVSLSMAAVDASNPCAKTVLKLTACFM